MKTILLIIATTCLIYAELAGQTIIPEPDYIGTVVYVKDSIGLKLEQQKSYRKVGGNVASFIPYANIVAGKIRTKNIIEGCCATIKISKRDKVQFIIKAHNNNMNPTQVISVFKLEQSKNQRLITVGSASLFEGITSGKIILLPFKATKYGVNSYWVEIENIEYGEYAITLNESSDVFNTFSVSIE